MTRFVADESFVGDGSGAAEDVGGDADGARYRRRCWRIVSAAW